MFNKKILIVDDDPHFRDILVVCLKRMNFETLAADGVQQAKQTIGLFGPDLILTDAQMPGETGIDLLKYMQSSYPEIPCVMMTGFSDLLDSVKAAELGASAFLTKPFREAELREVLQKALSPAPTPTPTSTSDSHEYCQIVIDDFISGQNLKYNIFIRVGSKLSGFRFIKVAHAGEDISLDRIIVYKEKGLTHLYILMDDFRAYIGLMDKLVSNALKPKFNISPEKKAKLLNHTLELINQELISLPISTESFEHVSSILDTTIKLMTSDEETFELLDSLEKLSEQVFSHSVQVSIYSTLIAKELGWESAATQMKVATAALIHDIGKRQLPAPLFDKRRSKMTADELKLYETHPQRGYEILAEGSKYSSDILQAVLHHHERLNGSGFPNHNMGSKIIPLAYIIAVADEFAHEYEKSKNEKLENPITCATQHILSMKSDRLHGPSVDALVTIFMKKSKQ